MSGVASGAWRARVRSGAVAACALTALALASPAGAATIQVETDGDQFLAGSDVCALREAVESARRNVAFGGCRKGAADKRDTIVLPGDTFLTIDGGGPANSAGDLDVTGGGKLTLRGAGTPAPSPPAIIQDGSDRHLELSGQRGVKIQGVELRGGDGVVAGGSILVRDGAALTLSDSYLIDNGADERGGAIACEGCRSLRLTGAFNFTNNEAFATAGIEAQGGAIYSDAPLTLAGEIGISGLPFSQSRFDQNKVLPGNGADGYGGAILATHHLRVRDVLFGANDGFVDSFGGAIAMLVPFEKVRTLSLVRTTLTQNEVDGRGGAISATADGLGTAIDLDVRRSAIIDNTASGDLGGVAQGGGLYVRGADGAIADSVVAGNTATGTSSDNVHGGGLFLSGGNLDGRVALVRTSVTENVGDGPSGDGGGIWTSGGVLHAVNSTISGNSTLGGGGAALFGGDARISHSTIADNTAGIADGLVHPSSESTVRFRATILDQPGDACFGQAFESAGYNVADTTDPDCALTAPTDSSASPILAALNENGSPAVGFGDPPPVGGAVIPRTNVFTNNASAALDLVPPAQCKVGGERLRTDARGAPRPAEDGCDAGAIERTPCLGVFVVGDGSAVGTKRADEINASSLSVVFAQGGDDFVSTGVGADRICAGGGDDDVRPGSGAGETDLVGAGPGTDLLNYNNAGAGTFDLAAGTATGASIGADTFTSVEQLEGSPSPDVILGDGKANLLIGGGDPDTIRGRGGIDVIDARDGEADTLIDCGPGKNSKERAKVDAGVDPQPQSC